MNSPLPTRFRRSSAALATLVASAWFLAAPGSAPALAVEEARPAPATQSANRPSAPSPADSAGPETGKARPGGREFCYSPPCPPGKFCAAYVICLPRPPVPPKLCRPLPCFKAPCPIVCTWPQRWPLPCPKPVNSTTLDQPLLRKA